MPNELVVVDPTPADPATAGGLIKSAASGMLASAVRTFTPILVAFLVKVFALGGIQLDNATAEQFVTGLISILIALVYYLGVRALERFKSTKFGWLLGFPAAPVYMASNPDPAVPNGSADQVQQALVEKAA